MAVILEILIPTYNRVEKLTALVEKFLQLHKLVDNGKLCITIFDNSDVDHSRSLYDKIGNYIQYNFNGTNVGYHGNIRKCFSSRRGVFKWIIADDDEINATEIPFVISLLERYETRIAGLALPYEVCIKSRNEKDMDISLINGYGQLLNFSSAIFSHRIPFDFLSSFIIKSEILERVDVAKILSTSDYFHSLVYCSCLRRDDLIYIHDKAIVSYVAPDSISWSLLKLVESKFEICDILANQHGVAMRKDVVLSEVLKWAIFSRVGITKIIGLDRDLKSLVTLALCDKSFLNLLLALLLVMPRSLTKQVVTMALAFSPRNNSALGVLQRIRDAKRAIK